MFLPSYLYQIAHLGDDDEEPEFSSAMPLEEGDTFFFQPRPLKNLVLVDELDSLSPILFCQVWVFPVISTMSSARQLFLHLNEFKVLTPVKLSSSPRVRFVSMSMQLPEL